MSQFQKFIASVLSGVSDATVDFEEFCAMLRRMGFHERIRGSHHIFTKDGVEEIINIQPKGRAAKPYQVKQIRTLIVKYRLGNTDE
jgi:predicted RNA binding protein YcfA (HicA-like mRNA interferase family)